MAQRFDPEYLPVFPEREPPKPTLPGHLNKASGDLKKDFEQAFAALFDGKD